MIVKEIKDYVITGTSKTVFKLETCSQKINKKNCCIVI